MSNPKSKLGPNTLRKVNLRVLGLLSVIEESLSASENADAFSQFALIYQKGVFLSKYVSEDTDPAETRRRRAIVKWLGVEQRNEKTNARLFNTDPSFKRIGTGWQILLRASSYVEKVIGREPPPDILANGSFSGGATTSRKRVVGCLYSKFQGRIDATAACWELLQPEVLGMQSWVTLEPEILNPRIVSGNVLFTVPKTAVIDRVAAKEPDANIFCQKAVGDFFRRRLRRVARIDLNDQSVNKRLAQHGALTGSLATIDLSSASDSLSDALVNILLPPKWYALLSALRSPVTDIDGVSHTNEMFSSMGNGFTFELESLVFWALAKSTCHLSGTRGRISVYGDDIIIPTSIARSFFRVLYWVGFTPNSSKSFVDGPFRESCGGHYYRGTDVTPFYLRRPITDVSDLILFLNQLRSWIIRCSFDGPLGYSGIETPLVRFWSGLSAFVPRVLRGGYDPTSRTQLVSTDPLASELVEKKIPAKRAQTTFQHGMYLHRLSCIENRGSKAVEDAKGVELVVPTTQFNIRRCRNRFTIFGVVKPLFLTEQLNYYGYST